MPQHVDEETERFIPCPAPACNHKDRESAIREHLERRDDQRHELFDGSEI